VNDVGEKAILRVRLMDRWDSSYSPPEDEDERRLVVCAESPGPDARVAVWDPETLRRLEEASYGRDMA